MPPARGPGCWRHGPFGREASVLDDPASGRRPHPAPCRFLSRVERAARAPQGSVRRWWKRTPSSCEYARDSALGSILFPPTTPARSPCSAIPEHRSARPGRQPTAPVCPDASRPSGAPSTPALGRSCQVPTVAGGTNWAMKHLDGQRATRLFQPTFAHGRSRPEWTILGDADPMADGTTPNRVGSDVG